MKKLLAGVFVIGLVGCTVTTEQRVEGTALSYQCEGQSLAVILNNEKQTVNVIIAGEPQLLHQVVSASGAKYSNSKYSFWSKGDTAMVLKGDDIIINDCKLVQ
ncbi:MliC family protein [Budviciaceae bacterium BWR-B9]|uniref:MliC family protein n=1 Tax=Limnobaculum allomyrinae TaxID=2791986 RepID=A0ABS1ILD6_9GAMM|nr:MULTISPECIES: MliC family protein [Limnobaculum]MBK5142407.1 MliC family protein [Limnobaculum allomyrinae]MBV7690708.1 MliC family protein [Limnobaculum sp. M2-1]